MKTKLNLDVEDFLSHYWQKKPLLIKGGLDPFTPPIVADELAGLAMEEEVESRIIDTIEGNWALQHGPFEEQDFDRAVPWTLLVQAVDHFVPEVADMRQLLDFIPSWRVDDVMVSYASEGGSVGPHYDNYDVFLLQGEGRRRWQIGQRCDQHSPLIDNPDLRIVGAFECKQEHVLSCGDILYLPPGVAHWGVALEECTTFSLGFRAPRINDMLSRQTDELLEAINPELFYTDANSPIPKRAGEIRPSDIEKAREQIREATSAQQHSRWFGELVTEPRYTLDIDQSELKGGRALLQSGVAVIRLLPSAKLAWQQCDNFIEVYANGVTIECELSVLDTLIALCHDWQLTKTRLIEAMACPKNSKLLELLHEQNCLTIE
ncbi:MAG: 50S ribosomal protein L16 3-hydroxylase [Halioglobus sp.]